jgi:hypothetical protein
MELLIMKLSFTSLLLVPTIFLNTPFLNTLSLYHGRPNLLWQRAKPVIVGCFAGLTWKNKWHFNHTNYSAIFIVYM